MQTIVERLGRLPTAMVSDVLRNLQVSYILDPAIRNLQPGVRLAGPAFTVLARPGSIITVHKALLEAPAGTVLVVGGETVNSSNMAMFGKLMSTQARIKGINGVIVDGAVRDSAELREMGYPVFARAVTPHVGLNRTVGQTQVPVPCGGLIVNPGDFIVGDDDGVVVIPQALAEEVIAKVESVAAKEQEYLRKMENGTQLTDLIGFTKIIYPE
jgi:4-hydroxy-4-methyl-2-oxoglutarate aldolase